ncbi:hypothetical protein D9Q98_004744 [Chlorella vulgaris]|uniref:protein-tyrosine-phosphatase n=1 Tax=Chlorella vulgaris TaxID=3077 RepID=A0A9D4TQH6_CHLVU|nr:hypothetical protein D9Q98_004744 [Chlorella vulgaris]
MPTVLVAGEVAPGLFLGPLSSLDHVRELGITHVVTVLNDPGSMQHDALGSIQQHLVDVEDVEEANLLSQLPDAVAFVAAALGWHTAVAAVAAACVSATSAGTAAPGASGSDDSSSNSATGRGGSNRVLIHCAQGVSRSAAVAAACLLARAALQPATATAPLEPTAAVAELRRHWPRAAPNPGFMAQLELFAAMGCRLLESYVPYKRFLLQQAAQQYQQQGFLDAAMLPQPREAAGSPGSGEVGGGATLYRCRKCRGLVATSDNVLEVEQGPGAAAFRWRKRDKLQREATSGGSGAASSGPSAGEDGSLFVEPLRWMCEAGAEGGAGAADSVTGGATQGKLYCPRCAARLGSFNWAGAQSSSGAWVTPSFQLHMAKLDALSPGPPAALAGIRQPRMLGGSGGGSSSGGVAAAAAQLQAASLADGAVPSAANGTAAADSKGASGTSHDAAAAAAAGGGTENGTADGGYLRYLIFDCDGVLVDSERASCEALRRAILQVTGFDIPHAFPEDFQPVFGMDVQSCVEYYQQRFERPDWGEAAFVAAEVTAAKEGLYAELTAGGIAAFPGVSQLVAQARSLGWGVAVASSGTPAKIAHNLGSSGLAHLFPDPHLIVSAKHVARGKPAPDVYIEALRRLGCSEPGRALVVEDAVNGLFAAKAAGCFAVGVATSLPSHMLEPHADLVLQHLCELDLAAVAPSRAR